MRRAALAAALLATAGTAAAQQKDPHLGYLYPAGGRQGSSFTVMAGGEKLDGATGALVLGGGISCEVVEHLKILTAQQLNGVRNNIERLEGLEAIAKTNSVRQKEAAELRKRLETQLRASGIKEVSLKAVREYGRRVSDPKKQLNPALSETVEMRLKIAPDAAPGERELRLKTPAGLSNPLKFLVGHLREFVEKEPNNKTPDAGVVSELPFVVNGQILPGDIDRFRFRAAKGTKLVAAVSARELIPYLADAVPGWFQATLALHDAGGKELVYQDDFRFSPDPVLFCVIPEDGEYSLEIKDSIFRGREDFVYRISIGELPFVTGVYPLGGRIGGKVPVEVAGWNLPRNRVTIDLGGREPGLFALDIGLASQNQLWNRLPFVADTVPDAAENEANDTAAQAQLIQLPAAVNGRIGLPGDRDVFRFKGRAGDEVVAEVLARRLNSPLDSALVLADADGKQIAMNDDCEDKASGLITHHADSRLLARLPADGTYFLRVGDSQQGGSDAHRYRLRVGPPQPGFALRVAPSCINVRPGESQAFDVYAVRHDGFTGSVSLVLKDAPAGFKLSAGSLTNGQEKARVTLKAPYGTTNTWCHLAVEGRAVVDGREISRKAVPAEDMMQAFFYRHLVPSQDELTACLAERRQKPAGRPK